MTIRTVRISGCLILTAVSAFPTAFAVPGDETARPRSTGSTRLAPLPRAETHGRASAAIAPVWFEPNPGRYGEQATFVARAGAHTSLLTAREAIFALGGGPAVRVALIGSNPSPVVAGVGRLPGESNYFVGRDPARWRTGVSHFARVHYDEVYPGVDLVFHGGNGRLEYDFVVEPGADPRAIALDVTGATRVALDRSGALVASTPAGDVRLEAPAVYQEVDGARRRVSGRFEMKGGRRVAFRLGAYDERLALTIDPQIDYSFTFGGSAADTVTGIAVDASGAAFVVGTTQSVDLPTVGPLDGTLGGASDVFVAKVNPDGTKRILYNPSNGKYVIFCNSKTYTGTGMFMKPGGGEQSLTESTATQKLTLTLKKKEGGEKGKTGKMTFESPPGTVVCEITDSDLKDSKQACPAE